MLMNQSPRLPDLTPGTVRRWKREEEWMPPQTQPLFRHLDRRSGLRTISHGETPPPGCVCERNLGTLHMFPAPGLRRLVHADHSFEMSDEEGELPEGHFGYGYLEQQPLPLLEGLELRRDPETEQHVLVAGPRDPLHHSTEPVAGLGFIEPTPILPRADEILHQGLWRGSLLRRHSAANEWRHSYTADELGKSGDGGGVVVGCLYPRGGSGLVALRRRKDGRLASDLMTPNRPSRHPRKLGAWSARRLLAGKRAAPRLPAGSAAEGAAAEPLDAADVGG